MWDILSQFLYCLFTKHKLLQLMFVAYSVINRSNMCCWYGLYTFVALSLYYGNINTCTKTGWKLWRAAPKGFLSQSYRAVFPVHKIDISSCFHNQNVHCLLDYDVSMSLTNKYKRCTYDLLQGPRILSSIIYHILVSTKGCL